jgi:hypothetical protein
VSDDVTWGLTRELPPLTTVSYFSKINEIEATKVSSNSIGEIARTFLTFDVMLGMTY